MLTTSTIMLIGLGSLIYISLIGLWLLSGQERYLVHLCFFGTYNVADFMKCSANQHDYPGYLYILWLSLAHLTLHLSLSLIWNAPFQDSSTECWIQTQAQPCLWPCSSHILLSVTGNLFFELVAQAWNWLILTLSFSHSSNSSANSFRVHNLFITGWTGKTMV